LLFGPKRNLKGPALPSSYAAVSMPLPGRPKSVQRIGAQEYDG
jgi:hypothetical protein